MNLKKQGLLFLVIFVFCSICKPMNETKFRKLPDIGSSPHRVKRVLDGAVIRNNGVVPLPKIKKTDLKKI